jgi:hypothetical protein
VPFVGIRPYFTFHPPLSMMQMDEMDGGFGDATSFVVEAVSWVLALDFVDGLDAFLAEGFVDGDLDEPIVANFAADCKALNLVAIVFFPCLVCGCGGIRKARDFMFDIPAKTYISRIKSRVNGDKNHPW